MVSYPIRLGLAAGLCLGLTFNTARAEDQALKQFEAELSASSSATQFLTDRCARLKLASPAVIRAIRDKDIQLEAGDKIRMLLGVTPETRLAYRRVKLLCGSHVLSEADNWYVPERLTPAMNRILDESDSPFGAVVRPLNFHRTTLKMEALKDDKSVLRVTAVLVTGANTPFSVVVENYNKELVSGSPH